MVELGGGGLNLILCQLVDWMFCGEREGREGGRRERGREREEREREGEREGERGREGEREGDTEAVIMYTCLKVVCVLVGGLVYLLSEERHWVTDEEMSHMLGQKIIHT